MNASKTSDDTTCFINIDDLYRVIGEFSKYQLLVFVLAGLLCTIPAVITYSYVFNGASPEYRQVAISECSLYLALVS